MTHTNHVGDGYIDPPHSLLRALDDLAWADRLDIRPDLHPDEMLLVIHSATGTWSAARAESIAARLRLVELIIYANARLGIPLARLARAAGLDDEDVKRMLRRHRTAR